MLVDPDLFVTFVSVLVDPDFITSVFFHSCLHLKALKDLFLVLTSCAHHAWVICSHSLRNIFQVMIFCEPYFQIFVNIYPRTLIRLEPKYHVSRGRG